MKGVSASPCFGSWNTKKPFYLKFLITTKIDTQPTTSRRHLVDDDMSCQTLQQDGMIPEATGWRVPILQMTICCIKPWNGALEVTTWQKYLSHQQTSITWKIHQYLQCDTLPLWNSMWPFYIIEESIRTDHQYLADVELSASNINKGGKHWLQWQV